MKVKEAVKNNIWNTSLFRKIYIIDLLMCVISFVQIPAYVLLVFLFVWSVLITAHNQIKYNTFMNLRFGLWIGAFLALNLISILLNFSVTVIFSIVMLLHVCVCFFTFYGMHTEQNLNFREELYTVCRMVVYIVTVANIIGIICLMCGIVFEWRWIKFTIYENRFTGIFYNPNQLGFVSIAAILCCHMLYKKTMLSWVSQPRVSKIWIITCLVTSAFSLMLCDSNAAMVLVLGYVVVYTVYVFFAEKSDVSMQEKAVSKSKIFLKIVSLFLVGAFLVGSVLMFREICKEGFSTVVEKTNSFFSLIFEEEFASSDELDSTDTDSEQDKEITFDHENTNIDSGRFKLWKESINLFKISPIIGISNGNIVFYSEEYSDGVLSYSYHNSDLHNGFLTILVSTGIIGFMLFAIFGFRFAKHAAQHLFLQKHTFKDDVYPCLFSFLAAYLPYSLFERALLYDISFTVIWFWLMMGYISCYVAWLEPLLETKYLFHKKRIKRTLL